MACLSRFAGLLMPGPVSKATTRARAKAKATGRTRARAKARARTKTKYRDLSTAAAKCAAFGRDDVCYVGGERKQATARAPARTTAKTRAGWEDVYLPTLATIKPSRRWGTQAFWLV